MEPKRGVLRLPHSHGLLRGLGAGDGLSGLGGVRAGLSVASLGFEVGSVPAWAGWMVETPSGGLGDESLRSLGRKWNRSKSGRSADDQTPMFLQPVGFC